MLGALLEECGISGGVGFIEAETETVPIGVRGAYDTYGAVSKSEAGEN